jgi:hypothetical protein
MRNATLIQRSLRHLVIVTAAAALAAAAILSAVPAFAQAQTLTFTDMQPVMVAGDPIGSPPDSPSNPYDPVTMTGRVDADVASSPFAGVGFVDAIGSGGTGEAISPTQILTAAHVITNGSYSASNPIKFSLNNGPTPTIITAASVAVDPLFTGVTGSDADDLAIITLSSPLPAGTPIYPLDTAPLAEGQTLTLVGYGTSGNGVTGYDPTDYPQSDTIKRVGENDADAAAVLDTTTGGFDAVAPYAGEQTYLFDFDGPDATTNIDFGFPVPNDLTLGNDVETTIGQGDSGGPAFILVNGQYEIAALNNFTFQVSSTSPAAGYFGSGGGGPVISGYTGTGEFLAPYAAPEPGPLAALGIGAALLTLKVRRKRTVR